MLTLGIETSCDETAVALVDSKKKVHAHCLYSQFDQHIDYRGVVPELAARAHLQNLPLLIQEAFHKADMTPQDISGIAVTAGPGLIGGVIVGVMVAKAMAAALQKPLIAINHLEAHVLTIRLTHDVPFPYLTLLISGGHGQFILVKDLGEYEVLGNAIDDAVGEAFDKVAKILDLGFPGGPAIEKAALQGREDAFNLPRPLKGRPNCDLSFAGLKTAVLNEAKKSSLLPNFKSNMAASFQKAVSDCLCDRTQRAIQKARENGIYPQHFVIAGGVAANQLIRTDLQKVCEGACIEFIAPAPSLCTDNGIMIAWAGIERMKRGFKGDNLDFAPKPRWPLTDL